MALVCAPLVGNLPTAIPGARAGERFYVAPSGSDGNPGTLQRPLRTLNYAVGRLHGGDTLLLREGTYPEALLNNVPSGISAANPVTLASYPGERAVLQAPPGSSFAIQLRGSFQHIVFRNLAIDAAHVKPGNVGVYISSDRRAGVPHHLRFEGCEVKNAPASAILLEAAAGAPAYNEFLECKIHDNGSTRLHHGFYISGNHNRVQGCDVYNNASYGVQIYNGTRHRPGVCSDNIVCKCRLHDNSRAVASSAGIVIDTGDNNLISNNLIWNNRGGGLRVDFGANATHVYNNTVTGNGHEAILIGYAGGATNTVIRNNIFYRNGGRDIRNHGSGTVADHNTDDGTNPLFVRAALQDYHLQATSPAIRAGLALPEVADDFDGIARPRSGACDIGAYEHRDAPRDR